MLAIAASGAAGCRAAHAERLAPRADESLASVARVEPIATTMDARSFAQWTAESSLRRAPSGGVAGRRAARSTRVASSAIAEDEPETVAEGEGDEDEDEDVEAPVLRGALRPLTCRGWRRAAADAPLGECPSAMVERVLAYNPDALVVLGGGLRLDGTANCATAERGYIAAQLFVALDASPLLVFTGHASRWIRRKVDAADVSCIAARIAQGALGEDVPRWAREQGEPRVGERYAVSEAESMCAVMLRALPEERHAAILERSRFDVRARDTVENARYTRAFLVERGAQRALVVTSPFIHPGTWKYYPHADRALRAFRGVRRDAGYALAAMACPRSARRAPWWEFEPVEGWTGPLRSRDVRERSAQR
ncbi:MAG: YdcF family protein [Myxococcales bacterium]|nr:YdcF family protein [Myxococcales bacterium]